MSETDKPDARIEETWICVGHDIGSSGKEVALFQPIDLEINCVETTREPLGFAFAGIVAGGVYDVKTTADRTRSTVPLFRQMWGDLETRLRWQITTKTTRVEVERRRAERRAKRDDALLRTLEPLRAAYTRAPYFQRRALEIIVLDYLRRPLPYKAKG